MVSLSIFVRLSCLSASLALALCLAPFSGLPCLSTSCPSHPSATLMPPLPPPLQFPEDAQDSDEEGSGSGAVSVGIRKENEFYRMDGEFSEKAVADFVDAYVKGSLKVCTHSLGVLLLSGPAPPCCIGVCHQIVHPPDRLSRPG